MLIWRDTKRGQHSNLEELNSETLLRNNLPKQKLHRGNCDVLTWLANYYEPAKPSCSTLKKVQEATKQSKLGKKASEIKSSLEMQIS